MQKLVSWAIGLAVVGVGAVGTAQTSTTIHYLPLGDSITWVGYYFNPLANLLSLHGYAADMIANEGHSGFIIDGSIAGAPRSGLKENIYSYLNHPNTNAPNTYILMMIGTNDVDTGFQLGDSQVQSRLGGLISSIESIAPLSHLVVAEITPNLNSTAKDQAVRQFNVDVAATVAAAKAAGGKVSLVDMYDVFNPSQYVPYTATWNPNMADQLHPNPAGGAIMAQVWFDGMQATAIPEPSALVLLGIGALSLLAYVWRRRGLSGTLPIE